LRRSRHVAAGPRDIGHKPDLYRVTASGEDYWNCRRRFFATSAAGVLVAAMTATRRLIRSAANGDWSVVSPILRFVETDVFVMPGSRCEARREPNFLPPE
jgi:hypothetical protein